MSALIVQLIWFIVVTSVIVVTVVLLGGDTP